MKKVFLTYGTQEYASAVDRICKQADSTHQFDVIKVYGPSNISEEVKSSPLMAIKRGGGLWVWKPDVILKTIQLLQDGDYLVYCDAGCNIQACKEWTWYWNKLAKYDIIAQRMYNRTDKWTRKEILDYFSHNKKGWSKNYQYQATIVLKVTPFTRVFVREWRNIMLKHPEFVMDVTSDERKYQHKELIENRHDQAVYSALLYKYMSIPKYEKKILRVWERIEDLHPFRKQAIRATRQRNDVPETNKQKCIKMGKRLIKEYFLYPIVFTPLQIINSKLEQE